MTDPFEDLGGAIAEQFPVRCYLASVTAVDTVTGMCSVDIGDGSPLTDVLYIGRPVRVGAQVLFMTFRRNAIVLGGDG